MHSMPTTCTVCGNDMSCMIDIPYVVAVDPIEQYYREVKQQLRPDLGVPFSAKNVVRVKSEHEGEPN